MNEIFFGEPISKGHRFDKSKPYSYDDELSVAAGGGAAYQSYGGDTYYTPLSHMADDREKFSQFESIIKDKYMIP